MTNRPWQGVSLTKINPAFLILNVGYHQMDVMGEALAINRTALLQLAEEADISAQNANLLIDTISEVASQFSANADKLLPKAIRPATLQMIQRRIDQNLALLRQVGRD